MLLYSQSTKNIKKASEKTTNKVKEVVKNLKEELKTEGDITALSIAYEKDDLREIKEFASFINANFKKIVIMGIGGSSLGAKTLCALKHNHPVIFLESIDSNTVKNTLESVNIDETAFLTVSKSGKTIECISQTLLALKMVEEKKGRDAIKKHFIFLTEDKESPLTNLAKEFGVQTLPHHKLVGGRFSYLSNVGLIPAAIAGLDIEAIRDGAAEVIDYVINNEDNFISEICAQQSELFEAGVGVSVVMPYVDRLKNLNEWYRQLWAESLGKGGYGTVPVDAMGTVDQHSQLQLYMDGPRDKFYTFILKDKETTSPKIEKVYNEGFSYLNGITLDEISDIEAGSTIEVLNRRELPIRTLQIHELNERCLSQLLMQYMLETIIVGRANGVSPFGQPAVEERKILARQMIGIE